MKLTPFTPGMTMGAMLTRSYVRTSGVGGSPSGSETRETLIVVGATANVTRQKENDMAHDGPGDPRLHALLAEIGELHDRKQQDYGRTGDPFANVRASEDFGVTGWIGTMIRANDKMRRVQSMALKGSLQNESLEDSLMDLAVYSLIAIILYRESTAIDEEDETLVSPEEAFVFWPPWQGGEHG